jgi:hypothetical protein
MKFFYSLGINACDTGLENGKDLLLRQWPPNQMVLSSVIFSHKEQFAMPYPWSRALECMKKKVEIYCILFFRRVRTVRVFCPCFVQLNIIPRQVTV